MGVSRTQGFGAWRAVRLAALGLLSVLLLAGAALPARAVTVGIGEILPGDFTSPDFTALGTHEVRTLVPWNAAVTANPTQRNAFAAWLAGAQSAGQIPLVSFAGVDSHVPTIGEYTRAIRAFIKRFPSVRRYTPWNEPDWVYRSLGREPQLAAQYFNALRSNCQGCLIVAGDVYLPATQLRSWLKAYTRSLRSQPQAWALHNYYDVRCHCTSQLQTMLSLTRGPIWLDETGGVLRRGHWQYHNQSAQAAARDERWLFSLPQRFPRISRIYHYQWQGTADLSRWDSGLIAANGVPRPAYYVVKAAATGR